MPATPLTSTQRFIEPGVVSLYWVATIASPAAPTRVELDAGTDLTGQINAINGFSVTSNLVDTPDFANRFVSRVPGSITAADSNLVFYRSEDSIDVRTLLTQNLTGFIVIFPEGDVATRTLDVFPVIVSSVSKDHSDSNPATITVDFAITSPPSVDVTVPAA